MIGMPGSSKYIGISYSGLIQRDAITRKHFCTSSFKFYIKYDDMTCYWVGHPQIKPIDIDERFKIKSFNDAADTKNQVFGNDYEDLNAE